tara:strand:+ start:1894 stop:2196 length:303 start_codon:yes stop_codon:yes gene_type:complete
MPLEATAFPAEVQVAFFVYSYLSDVWEGMSGSYMGKDWSHIDTLFNLFEVEEPKITLYFMKMYEGITVQHKAEEADRKRKADDRKRQQESGKNYTHNVRG